MWWVAIEGGHLQEWFLMFFLAAFRKQHTELECTVSSRRCHWAFLKNKTSLKEQAATWISYFSGCNCNDSCNARLPQREMLFCSGGPDPLKWASWAHGVYQVKLALGKIVTGGMFPDCILTPQPRTSFPTHYIAPSGNLLGCWSFSFSSPYGICLLWAHSPQRHSPCPSDASHAPMANKQKVVHSAWRTRMEMKAWAKGSKRADHANELDKHPINPV